MHVGVVDDGLWRGTGEFDGDPSIYFPDKDAGELTGPLKWKNKQTGEETDNPNGSHCVMVCGQLGADPDNGGNTGVASPVLGPDLTISVVNHISAEYGTARTATRSRVWQR